MHVCQEYGGKVSDRSAPRDNPQPKECITGDFGTSYSGDVVSDAMLSHDLQVPQFVYL